MKVLTYMCENCFEPHIFNPSEKCNEYLCPKCGGKMMYFGTEEIDPNTKKVTKRYDEPEREQANLESPIKVKPTIHCPMCNSANIKSISGLNRGLSIVMLGIFSKKINKSFECKNCGYTW